MRFIYKLTIPFLFAFQNSYCQDTISIRLSVNETFQTIERMSSIKIFNGKESISNHFLNDSMVVIDNLTNNKLT